MPGVILERKRSCLTQEAISVAFPIQDKIKKAVSKYSSKKKNNNHTLGPLKSYFLIF